jgi:hypothetical protein
MFSGVSIPIAIRSCGVYLYRDTAAGGPPVSSKAGHPKGSKQGGPLSFKIENTEPRKTRNPVNPGILQPKITHLFVDKKIQLKD